MNPYLFKHPEVRAIACELAKALADFDEKASAALMSAEQRIAALETTGGRHEKVTVTNIADYQRVAPHTLPPAPQDIDADAPLYCAGLSGRLV